jgi:dTDP-4-amino-4,6-dideoxygalactose transaminase
MNATASKDMPGFIPFHVPSIGVEEIEEVVDALKSGWLTTGPKTAAFEKKFREYVGSQHALAVNSCTAGLHLAMAAKEIGMGDEVITTPYTFAATGETIIQTGADPVLVDVERNGFNIDPDRIEEAITPRTKAIIPVHFAGEPCRMDELQEIAYRHDLLLIEDAAHALGASYHGKAIGTISDATVFSFYATKNLTTGEGGMVTTHDKEYADQIRRLSLHGLSRDAWNRYAVGGSWYYEIKNAGFKYNLTDIQSAIGLRQLDKFEAMQQKRHDLVQAYRENLQDMQEVLLPYEPKNMVHAWHLFVLRLRPGFLTIDRNQFIQMLNEQGVGTSVHFIPLHLHPFYQQVFGFKRGDFPNAEASYDGAISLPLYPQMTFETVEKISRIVRSIVKKHHQTVNYYVKEEIC